MHNKLSMSSVMGLVAAAGLLVASIFVPWWGMRFIAPQYPEGLDIIVYPTKLAGRIDIINGLNHYIGMKEFSADSFAELKYLPYLIVGIAILTLIVAVLRKQLPLYILIALFLIGGFLGIYDIHHWLVDFGTNLDPKAPIHIKPFVPPMIGSNRIANFITHSYFTYGSYLIGIAFLLMVYPLWKERRK